MTFFVTVKTSRYFLNFAFWEIREKTASYLNYLQLYKPQRMTDKDQTFAAFDFDPRLARAVAQLDFTRPTPVQAQGIPLALAGKDILARARTGSGKTAAYAMPIVQKILAGKEVKQYTI